VSRVGRMVLTAATDPPPLPPSAHSHPFAMSSPSSHPYSQSPYSQSHSYSQARSHPPVQSQSPSQSRAASPLPPLAQPLPLPAQPAAKTGTFSRAAGRLSAVGAGFRRSNSTRTTSPAPLPPPMEDPPPVPTGSHIRHSSISSRRSGGSGRSSAPAPLVLAAASSAVTGHAGQPGQTGPSVSPRASSLLSPAHIGKTFAEEISPIDPSLHSVPNGRLSAHNEHRIHSTAINGTYAPAASTSTSTATAMTTPTPTPKSKPPRTPSRHLLQSALDLAQRAVEMDKLNDVEGALAAYREAVERLKSVMERVGVESSRGEDGKRRRSTVGKSEEEGRTLRGIVSCFASEGVPGGGG
jgi:hypothetical protein